MAVFKCKMCGGSLILTPGVTVAECDSCGTRQTVPSSDNEKKLALFSRANQLRAACEFDKASGIYESLVAQFPTEAEAYWGLILCTYGIEYVDDPRTGKKIPTCHRASYKSIMRDENLGQALRNSDEETRALYREEAMAIDALQQRVVEVSSKEEPYDIFICYKETDSVGKRTLDSLLAQDLYDALTREGYRVFFSRITLEDKMGQEYEPFIFAALNSAKIMLAVGTSADHYNAVWVRNEWSRFLQLMASGQQKYLFPCYKNMNPYDLPEEFARLQGKDIGEIGAVQDVVRNIKKILPKTPIYNPEIGPATTPVYNPVISGAPVNVDSIPAMIKNGKKLEAIKLIRDAYGYSLNDGKAMADQIEQVVKSGGSYKMPPATNRSFGTAAAAQAAPASTPTPKPAVTPTPATKPASTPVVIPSDPVVNQKLRQLTDCIPNLETYIAQGTGKNYLEGYMRSSVNYIASYRQELAELDAKQKDLSRRLAKNSDDTAARAEYNKVTERMGTLSKVLPSLETALQRTDQLFPELGLKKSLADQTAKTSGTQKKTQTAAPATQSAPATKTKQKNPVGRWLGGGILIALLQFLILIVCAFIYNILELRGGILDTLYPIIKPLMEAMGDHPGRTIGIMIVIGLAISGALRALGSRKNK